MELRQLEYFSAVSSLKNFTKAAQFLHVSQPSVTKAIQSLEAELKLTLFNRSQKQIALTEAGQVFLIHTKKILQDVKSAQIAMERFQNNNAGVIRFGVPPIVESYLFPNLFIKFQAANPEIVIDLQECSDSLAVHEKLENGALDFGIVYLKASEKLENALNLLDDEFYLCLPLNHKLAMAEKISFQSLREEKFMTLAPTSDDIWFWLMGVLNGYKLNVVRNNLDALNYDDKLFFPHLKNVLDAYPVLKDILEDEWRRVN